MTSNILKSVVDNHFLHAIWYLARYIESGPCGLPISNSHTHTIIKSFYLIDKMPWI